MENPTGETALLVYSVATKTAQEVNEEKKLLRYGTGTALLQCKFTLGETWDQWRVGRGEHIQIHQMSEGTETDSTVTQGQS